MFKKIFSALCLLLVFSMPITIASTTKKQNEVHFSVENTLTTSINQVSYATQEVESIVRAGTYKTAYFVNDSINLTNSRIFVTFADGTTHTINVTVDMITGFDTSTTGTKTMTITYIDATTTVSYTVSEPKVTVLELRSTFQTNYYTGESLNLVGGVIFAKYENNKTEELYLTNAPIEVTGFSTATAGTRNMTIKYKEKSLSVSYTVTKLLLIKLETADFEIDYFVGDTLANPCGKVRVYYNDGRVSLVNITPSMVTNFDTSTDGSKVLTITYTEGSESISISVDYNVVKVFVTSLAVKSFDTSYFVGESLPNPCGVIKATHNNGAVREVNITPSMVTNFDTTFPGTSKIATISYGGQSINVDYDVVAVVVTSISVNTPYPDSFQLEYYQNEPISLEGGTLTARYNNGDVETAVPITNDMVSNFATEYPGTYEIKITYKNAYTIINYVVTEVNITYIEISTGLSKSDYYMYEPLNLTGCTIKVVYDNNNVEYVPANDIEVHHTGFANTLPGEDKVLTFHYEGFETTLTYNIIDAYIIVDPDLHLEFSVGDSLDLSGISATLYTDNYSNETELTITADMISGFDTSTAGTRYLTLSYTYGKPALIPYTVS